MDKEQIIREIQRTAKENGGISLGWKRFETVTGIGYHDWYGRYWSRWGDAVKEAGVEPNRMSVAYDDEYLICQLVMLTRRLGRVPTHGDLRLASKDDAAFPSDTVFRRLGLKPKRVDRVVSYCKANPEFEDVGNLWQKIPSAELPVEADGPNEDASAFGYVYLLKHGSRREYKIGRTNNPLRREGEIGIELPEQIQPVQYIQTDDPAGVENYWHRRFASKRKEGEWFALSPQDVKAFKRWKRIY